MVVGTTKRSIYYILLEEEPQRKKKSQNNDVLVGNKQYNDSDDLLAKLRRFVGVRQLAKLKNYVLNFDNKSEKFPMTSCGQVIF